MKRKTVGQLSSELLLKEPETRSPIDIEREALKDYEKNIKECIDTHKKKFDGDFYILVITKQERLMRNVIRNFFTARQTCPTPDYDQTVFKYHRESESVEFIWVIPSKDSCIYLKNNALFVHPAERGLLNFVLKFADGTLYKLCKKLNNESIGNTEAQFIRGIYV